VELEGKLKRKLMAVQEDYRSKAEKLVLARELESKAQAIRDEAGGKSRSSSSRKRPTSVSDSESEPDRGICALDNFLNVFKRKIDRAEYIDFASISTSRLAELKMLNASSAKTSRIAAGLVVCTSLTEADVKILSEDLAEILYGFFYHYLGLISESRLDSPIKVLLDRISWWQWIATNFVGNPAANVLFIKKFMVEHHKEVFWTPIVKQCHSMVTLCKEKCGPHMAARPTQAAKPATKTPSTAGGKGSSGKKSATTQVYTTAQQAKLVLWKARFQGICLSRVVRGRGCYKESKGTACSFTHNCAWCGSATCKATCAHAEQL
jgi:hypothetical protein